MLSANHTNYSTEWNAAWHKAWHRKQRVTFTLLLWIPTDEKTYFTSRAPFKMLDRPKWSAAQFCICTTNIAALCQVRTWSCTHFFVRAPNLALLIALGIAKDHLGEMERYSASVFSCSFQIFLQELGASWTCWGTKRFEISRNLRGCP